MARPSVCVGNLKQEAHVNQRITYFVHVFYLCSCIFMQTVKILPYRNFNQSQSETSLDMKKAQIR